MGLNNFDSQILAGVKNLNPFVVRICPGFVRDFFRPFRNVSKIILNFRRSGRESEFLFDSGTIWNSFEIRPEFFGPSW